MNRVQISQKLKYEPAQVTVMVYFSSMLLMFTYDGKVPLFEAMREAGFEAPYPCLDSECTVCKIKIEDGAVFQPHSGGLSKEELSSGYALACLATPITPLLKISI